jgi:flavin-dependent dehydrogenase
MAIAAPQTAALCVIGAGPAGNVLAARMAQLGHEVCLIERATFPRSHLGESLSPGVLPLLETICAGDAIESGGVGRVRSIQIKWDADRLERRDVGQGFLVDRGRFDQLLMNRARALGVRVLQPAAIRQREQHEAGWSLWIETPERTFELRTAFLADASGRSAVLPGRKRSTGRRTLALHGYWRGRGLPRQPRIEAGSAEWYWGVPLPDGRYNTLAFVDVERFRAEPKGSITARFRELIDRSGMLAGCPGVRLASPVVATDATPYIDEHSVTVRSIKVGDAALAIDPLASSGVQKAIQTAMAGAVVVNTLLRKPESRDAAMCFYRNNLSDAADRHRRWSAAYYQRVAARQGGRFWEVRAAGPAPQPAPASPVPLDRSSWSRIVELSSLVEFADLPCIEGDFITVKTALRHPALDGPLAFLGGWDVASLLTELRAGMTPLQIAHSWSCRIPLESSLAVVNWLLGHGVLVPAINRPAGVCS